jgi:hypothetical protein
MKRHARKAFNALKKLGAPVLERSDVAYFVISGEDNYKEVWADYYEEFGIHSDSDTPGVDPRICDIIEANGLFMEWETPGGLVVYDA